jgi:hypothetical protein
MIYQEIVDLAVYQSGSMGSDEGLSDREHDAQTLLKRYVNEAYRIIARDFYKPYKLEEIALDEDGGFDPSALSEAMNEIIAVSKTKEALVNGNGARAVYDPLDMAYNRLTSDSVGNPGESVWIKYTFLYPDMDTDTDTPRIPEAYHALLADYATWRYMSTGNSDKQNRAQFFYARWYEETQKIQKFGARSYITNRFRNLWER